MSKKDIQKNLDLSIEFNSYVARHPEIVENISASAYIVMAPSRNSELTRKNQKLAKEIIQKEHKKCYQAIRLKNSWKLEPVR